MAETFAVKAATMIRDDHDRQNVPDTIQSIRHSKTNEKHKKRRCWCQDTVDLFLKTVDCYHTFFELCRSFSSL